MLHVDNLQAVEMWSIAVYIGCLCITVLL